MYMSYCRFEGTHSELQACLSDVYEHVNEEAEYEVSDHEIRHFRLMVNEFFEFLKDADLLTDDGELDRDGLDEICKAMAQSYGEEEW